MRIASARGRGILVPMPSFPNALSMIQALPLGRCAEGEHEF
jgi:hypothetical protein